MQINITIQHRRFDMKQSKHGDKSKKKNIGPKKRDLGTKRARLSDFKLSKKYIANQKKLELIEKKKKIKDNISLPGFFGTNNIK